MILIMMYTMMNGMNLMKCGYKINKEILNEVSLLREEVYLLDKMHSGLLENFFINHISVLENICDQSSEEFISSTDEEDFI